MVGLKSHRQRLEQSLRAPDNWSRATHVLQQQQLTSRTQDPKSLGCRSASVGDRAETKCAGHGVKGLVRELKRLHVAEAQIGRMAKLLRALAPDRQHLRTQLDPREVYVVSV